MAFKCVVSLKCSVTPQSNANASLSKAATGLHENVKMRETHFTVALKKVTEERRQPELTPYQKAALHLSP